MRYQLLESSRDEAILAARILLMILFVIFGWSKLTNFSGTAGHMGADGLPLPAVAAVVVIVMELVVGIALALGFNTRPVALLLALYTLGTALIGHDYWTMTGGDRAANMINFYKNISIVGGLLLLCVTGPGKYSIDGK